MSHAVNLSTFAGFFGAEWFYLSRGSLIYITVGGFKLLMTISSLLLMNCTRNADFLGAVLLFIVFVSNLIEIDPIRSGRIPDGNLMPLADL